MKNKFKPLSNGFLVVSDRPEDTSGLARVARDIASLACTMPELRVGFLARGGQGLRKLPFTYYSYPETTGAWGQQYLAGVAKDFFGSEHGIVFSNWDVSRLGWLADSRSLGEDLQKAYGPGRNWDAWGYFPVDGVGPDGNSLSIESRQTLGAFDRVMAASEWGGNVLKASGRPDAEWLPHGINTSTFSHDPKAREKVGWNADEIWCGAVMTNQSRKDYPVAFETIAILKQKYGNRLRFWLHADLAIRHWNIYSLAMDYGVSDCIYVSTGLTDAELALRYSACDCTILPSAGEGFSFPTAESLSCGTACVVTDYAAAQELVPESCRVTPVTYRIDTVHNVRRAVLSGHGFANAAIMQIEAKLADPEYRAEELRETVSHLDWQKLKYPWMSWLRSGLRG